MATAASSTSLALLCELDSLMEAAALLARMMEAELRTAAARVPRPRRLSARPN